MQWENICNILLDYPGIPGGTCPKSTVWPGDAMRCVPHLIYFNRWTKHPQNITWNLMLKILPCYKKSPSASTTLFHWWLVKIPFFMISLHIGLWQPLKNEKWPNQNIVRCRLFYRLLFYSQHNPNPKSVGCRIVGVRLWVLVKSPAPS